MASYAASSAHRSTTRWPPTAALSSAPVPSATMAPRSSRAIRSASRSASSMYWVVRKHGHPACRELTHLLPQLLAAAGIQSCGGFVEEDHPGPAHQRGGEVEPAPHSSGIGGDPAAAGIDELEPAQQLRCAGAGASGAQTLQAADHRQVLHPGLEPVEGGVLTGQADPAPGLGPLADDVPSRHPCRACVRRRQSGQHPDGGRLAGAVGPEQRVDVSGRDLDVDAIDDAGGVVGLLKAGGLDCQLFGHGRPPTDRIAYAVRHYA